MAFDINMIKNVYKNISERVDIARKITGNPLTLSEKILYSHLWDSKPNTKLIRGKDYVDFAPDRIALKMQQPKWLCCSLCKLEKQK